MTTNRQYHEYHESMPVASPALRYIARPELRADFAVPLAQAAVIGLLGGALAAMVGGAVGMTAFTVGASAGVTIALGVFIWRMTWASSTIRGMERILQRDLDGDGAVGEPEPARAPIILNGYAGRQRAAAEERATGRDEFEAFVIACEHNTASRAHPGLTRESYRAYRDSLLSSGHARWRRPGDEKAGWELVSSAAEVLEALG